MTVKQIERIKKKIAEIRTALLSEKRKFGAIDDGYGRRYMPPTLYIQIGDYAGGLAYTKWFDKNFPDDIGFPHFLFEWTILLYKNGKIKEAGKKAFETFCSNTYVFDKFFGREIKSIDKFENSGDSTPEYAASFGYSSQQDEISDFAEWLKEFTATEKFKIFSQKYIAIYSELNKEDDYKRREYLLDSARLLAIHFNDKNFQPDKLYFSE